jgi:hypothetical protein
MSRSSKVILIRTSNSPLQEGKNTKTFVLPNCFVVLASIDPSDDSVFDAIPQLHDNTVVLSSPSSDQASRAIPNMKIKGR